MVRSIPAVTAGVRRPGVVEYLGACIPAHAPSLLYGSGQRSLQALMAHPWMRSLHPWMRSLHPRMTHPLMALCPLYFVACLFHCGSTATGAESGAKSSQINTSSPVPTPHKRWPPPEPSHTPGSELLSFRLPPPCPVVASRVRLRSAPQECVRVKQNWGIVKAGWTRRSRHVTRHSGSGVALTDTASLPIPAQERAHAGMHHGAARA